MKHGRGCFALHIENKSRQVYWNHCTCSDLNRTRAAGSLVENNFSLANTFYCMDQLARKEVRRHSIFLKILAENVFQVQNEWPKMGHLGAFELG